MSTAELLLHPVRLRIVQAFLGNRAMTTTQLRTLLTDIPPATLYRQVATLLDRGVLRVAQERRVRGAVERTYELVAENAVLGGREAASMSADDHRRAFLAFAARLLADFDRYLDAGAFDLAADVVGYRQAALYLTDDEAREMVGELDGVVGKYLDRTTVDGRRRRLFSRIIMPGS